MSLLTVMLRVIVFHVSVFCAVMYSVSLVARTRSERRKGIRRNRSQRRSSWVSVTPVRHWCCFCSGVHGGSRDKSEKELKLPRWRGKTRDTSRTKQFYALFHQFSLLPTPIYTSAYEQATLLVQAKPLHPSIFLLRLCLVISCKRHPLH